MKYMLVIYFTCGVGCGTPSHVNLPTVYKTYAACAKAGAAWTAPAANPTKAISLYRCKGHH